MARTPRRSKGRPETFFNSNHSFALAAEAFEAGAPIQAISFKIISRVGAPDTLHEQGASGTLVSLFASELFSGAALTLSSFAGVCGELFFAIFSPDDRPPSAREADGEIFSADRLSGAFFPASPAAPDVSMAPGGASSNGISITLPDSFVPEKSSPSVCHAIAATPWLEGEDAEEFVAGAKKLGANAPRATPPRNNPRAPSPKTKFRGNRKREPALPGSPNSDRSSSRWSME